MPHLPPLPQCEGPKLEPFTHDFESLKLEPELLIGDLNLNAHGMVLKAKLDGKTYAIKFFVQRWLPPDTFIKKYPGLSEEEHALARIHDDPFYAECRAFGRLKETGMEHLAVKVHGYIKVDSNERTTEMFRSAFPMGYDEGEEAENLDDFFWRGNINCETGEQIPVMGIVKDWIDGEEQLTWSDGQERQGRARLRSANSIIQQASTNLDNLHQLHRHGIVVRDLHIDQYIGGTLVDLSFAWTTPHVLAQGDRFRPNWSLASLAARDLFDYQETLGHAVTRRDLCVSSLRRIGLKVPKIRTCKVVAYQRQGTRQGLRPRPPRWTGGGKRLPLLSYRVDTPYNPDDPVPDLPARGEELMLWAYGPKYDPALFQWREVGNGKIDKVDETKSEEGKEKVVKGKRGKVSRVGKAGKIAKQNKQKRG